MSDEKKGLHQIEWSAILTFIGIVVLFSGAVIVTLLAPSFIDPSWKEASSVYQIQMYTVSDPHVYVGTSSPNGAHQYVYHLKEGYTLLAFQETETTKIDAEEGLERYITKLADKELKLTTRVLLLRRHPDAKEKQKSYQDAWKENNSDWREKGTPHFTILELYDPKKQEAFAITETDGIVENWIAKNFKILESLPPYQTGKGTIYINNPQEYRTVDLTVKGKVYSLYDENGKAIEGLKELTGGVNKFLSRASLIRMGEDIYRIEGCWYCHTDQTRTLIQDTVLNGSAEYPAPPSSANEYVFQRVTFPGTRRIGPDLSRVGIKRPHRDWHMSHFWSPKVESKGSIMPSFKHFFDKDPSGTPINPYGVPNYMFEAVFQYLMTKGTRITSPDQAWWRGKDPIHTLEIIEGRK